MFDFDGTLTAPGSLDFPAVKEAMGCPTDEPILEYIESLPSEPERVRARRILEEFEIEAARSSKPNAGAEELILYLRSIHLKVGIISRNSLRSIRTALQNFHRVALSNFEVILTRDDTRFPKPNPESVLAAADRMQLSAGEILVVGDYIFDVEAGRMAGSPTVFLSNRSASLPAVMAADFTIEQLSELHEIIALRRPLPAGKLPNDLLHQFLNDLALHDAALLIPPRVGEDIAAVNLDGREILILKSDPITFAIDSIGFYSVVVNTNDVATSGATPRWLLTTLLFPPETSAFQIRQVMTELDQVSRNQGLILCGGHTEITDAVNRTVVVGQVIGTVSREKLIDKRNMQAADCILLTKGIAVEGTSIIARELPDRLAALGMTSLEIETCRQYLTDPGISITKEARIAADSGSVTAMHDVTEGGVATALRELSAAADRRIRVYPARIPILEETSTVCRLLELDPLGLIGSGSLLIACRKNACERLIHSIRQAGIEVVCIGEAGPEGVGVEAFDETGGKAIAWPQFDVDEIARLFGQNPHAV